MTIDDAPLLVHSVSWAEGGPRLVVSDPLDASAHTFATETPTPVAPASATGRRSLLLLGERLAFAVDDGRWCTGLFVASNPDGGRHQPCPGNRLATVGTQCERCAAQDESRFMHHAHRGGYVPDSLTTSLAQPHWLYVATFADGTSKVGTASDHRKRVRLDEQGAVRATYVAHAADGRTVRVLEDAVTEHVGIAQTKHKSSKAAALTRALPAAELDARHRADVDATAAFLRTLDVPMPLEAWQPPSSHRDFFAHTGVHPFYPHILDGGEHCITPHAMVGGVALISVNDDANSPASPRSGAAGALTDATDDLMLLDLDRLRGRRITFGAHRSPESATQHSLF